MGKTKTLRKPRASISKSRAQHPQKRIPRKSDKASEASLREDVGITEYKLEATLLDIKLIGTAIVQCLIDNDPDGVVEIIEGHLSSLNKSRFLKNADVPRSTMYRILKQKNPTIKTLAKIMHAAHQDEKQQAV